MSGPLLLRQWDEIIAAGVEQAGGKGWNLAQLARYGLPVPKVMIIPVRVAQQWLGNSGLKESVAQAVECMLNDGNQELLLELQESLLSVALPAGLLHSINEAITDSSWHAQPLAIRSSAAAEDSATASFAGIHRSRLNVIGAQAVARSIIEVWVSQWSPAAVVYRHRMKIKDQTANMAVLIMPLLSAEASGIAFTCDPVSGRDDRTVIHANWGLGEALVGGLTGGDEIILAESPLDGSLTIDRYQVGEKKVTTMPVVEGCESVTTSTERARQRVLSDQEVLKLGRLLRNAAIAMDFSAPFFDLEWVRDARQFWLVQARPVTSRGRNTYDGLLGQPDIWSRGNTCELLPYPLSAIDWFYSRRMVNLLLEQGLKMAGYPLQPGLQRAGLLNGRLYLNLSLMQWEYFAVFGLEPRATSDLMGGHQPEIDVPKADIRQKFSRLKYLMRYLIASGKMRKRADSALQQAHATAKSWRLQPVAQNEQELLQSILDQARYVGSSQEIFFLQASSGASISMLVDKINKLLPGEGHAMVAALLTGEEPTVTARQAYAMVELAHTALLNKAARQWLETKNRDQNWRHHLAADNPFRIAFEGFLEQYGHRAVYESYFRHARWRDEPGYLLDTIAALMHTDIAPLRQRQQHNAKVAHARLKQKAPFWLYPLLRSLIRGSIRETHHREAARSALMALMEAQCRTILAVGTMWQQQGLIIQADDIWNLTAPEVCDVLSGEVDGAGLKPRIAVRQQQMAAWAEAPVDPVVIEHAGNRSSAYVAADLKASTEQTFSGVAVGSGKAQGIARLLNSPVEGHRLLQGEVLVSPSTDPSWTPLFLKAGALVMETGGYLSHGAIVAREFGIPAVVNLPGIFDLIEEGELLEVDGYRGVVTRLGKTTAGAG